MRLHLWHQYVWEKQSLTQLSQKHRRSIPWIRKILKEIKSVPNNALPQPLVLIGDVTFFNRSDGVIVFRSPRLKQNILWNFTKTETVSIYREARYILEQRGFRIQAMVLDGRKGVREVFSDIPVQMCHFHQLAILKRYLTSKPKLLAGQELQLISKTLPLTTESIFTKRFDDWYEKWVDFIREKTFKEDGVHWQYTHKKIRASYRSLKTNLPFLFTFQKYPELHIPNTTNSLDGFFSHMKKLLRVHSGLSKEFRNKVVSEILRR